MVRQAHHGSTGSLLALRMSGYSMMPVEWLQELYDLAGLVQDLPGAVVECGVYNGGSAVMLATGSGMTPRDVWLFDSWAGLPQPGKFDGIRAYTRWNNQNGKMNIGEFNQTLKAFSGLDCNLHLRPGWFHQTIPGALTEIGPIARGALINFHLNGV